MTESDTKKSPVMLTEESPEHVDGGAPVVFGNHVRHEAARRSEMLSGVGNTHGAASLPGHLSSDDIRLWETACLVDCTPSTSELVTILKVADLLGDSHIASWVDKFAKRISPPEWKNSKAGTALLCALLQLPSHLLRRVLTACLARAGLEALLSALPTTLHPVLVSSCVSGSSITLPVSQGHLHTVLSQLSSTPHSSPGLLSMSLPAPYTDGIDSETSAALMAHAASSHPSLTSLDLSSHILSVDFFRQLGLGLGHGTLPNLQSFQASIRVRPDGCAELARCLKHLSALTVLQAELCFNSDSSGIASSLGAYVGVAASPAPLVNLQHLDVEERHHYHQRDLHSGSRSVAHRLFPLLATPNLTSLTFTSDVAQGSMPALIASLSHMTSLQKLNIDADMIAGPAPSATSVHTPDSQHEDVLPRLNTLSISSACMVSPVATAAAVTAVACSSLTRLRMHHSHVADRKFFGYPGSGHEEKRSLQAPTGESIKKAWADFTRSLGTCSQLLDLQLSSLCSLYAGVSDAGFSEGLASALLQLPLLTRLRLEAGCKQCYPEALCQLQGEALGRVLRGLTRLRELGVCGAEGALEVSGSERVLAVLPELQQLTTLGLCFPGLQQADVAELIPKLRALKELAVLEATMGENDEQIVAFIARFSALSFKVWNGPN